MRKPDSCKTCPLYGDGNGFSSPSGTLTHGVALLGEALGEEEALVGLPFQGPAGRQLNRMLERLVDPATGLTFKREDFRVYNTIQCRPPNNELTGAPYEHEALQCCSHFLAEQLRADKPKVVVALGNQALRRATANWGIDQLRGYYFRPENDGFEAVETVVGSYHPSFIMRGKFNLARVVQLDILKAVRAARGEVEKKNRKYVLFPTVKDFQALLTRLKENPETPLAFDIETPYGDVGGEDKDDEFIAVEDDASYTILRISFSDKEGWGITAPWQEPYISLSRELLRTPNPKVSWNGTGFDIPRLVANGMVFEGLHFDSMQMWHALEPSLPMGLKYVATFYCVMPDTPILTSRLDWVRAGTLQDGDKLLGFDETTLPGKMSRSYKEVSVVKTRLDTAEIFEVKLSDGSSVRTTAEHPWLAPTRSGYVWKHTAALTPGTPLRRAMSVWEEEDSKEAGWIAGIFDGEGHLSFVQGTTKLGFAQNPGAVLEKAKAILLKYGYTFSCRDVNGCHRVDILGGIPEILRFLGQFRPERLLEKCKAENLGDLRCRRPREVKVVSVKSLGLGQIQRLETSGHTYFAAGFPMHNCPDMPPWKLQAHSSPEFYSAADADVTICCYNGIRSALEAQGRWKMYERHFAQVDTQLRRMSRRGIPVDKEKRRIARERFEGESFGVLLESQPLIPLDKRKVKIYTYDEERLKRQGMWEEGKMLVVKVPHTLKETEEVVEGWVKKKPKPAKEKKCSERKSKVKKSESDSPTAKKVGTSTRKRGKAERQSMDLPFVESKSE